MRIHFIAIGGVIMHSLAIELKKQGHHISGSDDNIYDPSRKRLLEYGLLPEETGWFPDKIHSEIDLVLLGMHAKKNNPELNKAQKIQLPILSFPEFISNYHKYKKRIVIAGSHGKTTITSMILHVLSDNNIEVDYLLGASNQSFKNLVSLKKNNILLVEGDEYFSSYIDKRPKFMHYKPDILVVSGVSWDHINVFPTLESYETAFKNIIRQVVDNCGKIFYCGDDNFLSNYLTRSEKHIPYFLPNYKINNHQCCLIQNNQIIKLHVFGKHNLYNINAALGVCLELGLSCDQFYNSISKYRAAYKRLSLIKKGESSSIYFDFAHSPSKVLATINAVKELYPERYLISCFELYTFSSLNKEFIPQYENAFKKSNEVWIYVDLNSNKVQNNLSASLIRNSINHSLVYIIERPLDLKKKLEKIDLENLNLLIMSSGNISGIDLLELFKT